MPFVLTQTFIENTCRRPLHQYSRKVNFLQQQTLELQKLLDPKQRLQRQGLEQGVNCQLGRTRA